MDTETKPHEPTLTEREKRSLDYKRRAAMATTDAQRKHWLRRAVQAMGVSAAASIRAKWIVKHTTNRHERRKARKLGLEKQVSE